ncbi:MAG TPA: sensor histidine kinase [Steroidobacteraceae bacterium]|jgi:signal transduction histidine kinase
MKPASWACCAISVALLLSACGVRVPAPAETTRGEYAIQWFGMDPWPPSPAVVPDDLAWRAVELPYIGERDRGGFGLAGKRASARVWLRVVDVPGTDPPGPRALAYSVYLPTGSAAVLYVDGQRLVATDPTLSNAWQRPVMFQLPYGSDGGHTQHTLVLSFDCSVGLLGCGVPALRVGPLAPVTDYFEWQNFLRIDAPRVGSGAILIVGVFALLFWIRRRHEVEYALFFIASLLWMLRTLHYHLSRYPEPQEWFWWVTVNSLAWLAVTIYMFAFRLHGERQPRIERALIAGAAFATLSGIPFLNYDSWIGQQIQYGVQTLLSVVVTILLSVAAWRRRTREHIAMAVALWVNLCLGVHDWMLENWTIGMQGIFLLPYAAVPLFAAFIYAMARRYRSAISDAEVLNASLEQRLAERQRELDASYAQLRRVEVESARHQERQRLMRDMHDGLGSSLMSSLALAERGEADHEFVLRTLREAVDELKLTIDSLEPIDSDLATLLAALRYRIGPRLKNAGLTVDWDMPDLPKLEWLDAAAALQILRIVQESITNVVKHARASRLQVAAAAVGSEVRVTIADDGVGYDAEALALTPTGRGLRNLRHRATQLGADIEMKSGSTGTVVSLHLPFERRRTPR